MYSPPPPSVLAVALLSTALGGRMAFAADEAGPSCGVPPDSGDRGAMELSWLRGVDGSITPSLQVRPPDVDGLSARLDIRLWFAGRSWTWSSEPVDVPAYTTTELGIEGLDGALFDDEQFDWLSTLSTQVVLLDGSGAVVMRKGAPLLQVAFDEHGALLLDDAEAAALSVDGAWSAAALSDVEASRTAGDEEFNTWYGRVTP